MLRGLLALALAAGAIATTALDTRPQTLATVAGFRPITSTQVDAAIDTVDVGEVPRQFSRDDIRHLVLTELIGLDVDTAVAKTYAVAPDPAAAQRELTAAAAAAGGTSAYQQELIRSPGLGWAGPLVYLEDRDLRARTAVAAARTLTPPDSVLRRVYAQQRGMFEHADVEILATPDEAAATAAARATDFAALVATSTDPASGHTTVTRGQLFTQVDDAIFAARPGDTVGPVTVQQSHPEYYVVHVLALTDISFDQAEPQLLTAAKTPTSSFVQATLAAERASVPVDRPAP